MTAQTDPFTAARPEFRRAMAQASKPMPLLAGEVATFSRRRPVRFWIVTIAQGAAVLLMITLFWSGLNVS